MTLDNRKTLFAGLKKNQKLMMILIISATILTLLVYFNLLLKPQVVKGADLRSKLSKVSADLRIARSDIAKISSMKKAVEAYNTKISQYEKTLPTEDGIPSLLESLSDMAKSSNMNIAGIVPVQSKDITSQSRAYKEIPIMVTAKAGYHELGRFMSSLENSDRFIKIADMQIKFNKPTPKKHDIELLVVTYVLLEGK